MSGGESVFPFLRGNVLGAGVDLVGCEQVISSVLRWGREGRPAAVCFCNVHSVVTARQDPQHAAALRSADLVAPDGAPVALLLSLVTRRAQSRVSGPDVMWHVCERAAQEGLAVFFYGGSERTLDHLIARLRAEFPQLRIAGAISPPFRTLTEEEVERDLETINSSSAAILWVGLGCPKQEKWMYTHQRAIRPVMLGVGAAFEYQAGVLKRAPAWMRSAGLVWLHRLTKDPKRLWRRYLFTNTAFIACAARELVLTRFWTKPTTRRMFD
jgi:N-acetylglucosaminyldiphosphoundecaprenol N-acetyl-beta-D-mannosaminyltransferase